MQYSSVVRRWT